ncbi:hypothetical protein AAHA92_21810 [Salvia divinorum]|uniref:Myb-like domain-containing protein n=1 Tax=Salvia divinorum TaxID=28513 RepID=A0ABD1GLN4_SALDI
MSTQQNGGNDNEGSPATEGSNEFVRGKTVKTDKSRRCWSVREEAVMMVALKDLAAHGWKSDNGFRAVDTDRPQRRECNVHEKQVLAHKIYGTLEKLHSDTGTSNPMTFEEFFPDDILPDGVLHEMVGESPTPVERTTAKTPKRVIKKRKVEDKLDEVIDLMNHIHENTNERLKEIAS